MKTDLWNGEVPRFKGTSVSNPATLIEGAGCYTDVNGKAFVIEEGDGDMPVFKRVQEIELDLPSNN